MDIKIITGLSGAGKSLAMNTLEDQGYYCVDNLPPVLIGRFAELCESNLEEISKVALVVDIRGGIFFEDLFTSLGKLVSKGHTYEVFFFEASDAILIKRFKETRRSHPLNPEGSIAEGIEIEKKKLHELKSVSDYVIDTSGLTIGQFRQKFLEILSTHKDANRMTVNVQSFGFKKGIPLDADFVFDVRFLPNPYYVEELRAYTGNEKIIQDYVMKSDKSQAMLKHIQELVEFVVPSCANEGRSNLIIAIGCTGGHHRSVTLANLLTQNLTKKGHKAFVYHRDID